MKCFIKKILRFALALVANLYRQTNGGHVLCALGVPDYRVHLMLCNALL